MYVKNETKIPQGFASNPRCLFYVEGFENRVHADPVAGLQLMGEIDGIPIYQHEVDLGVGNTEILDHLFGSCSLAWFDNDVCFSLVPGQKIIQLFIKTDRYHLVSVCPFDTSVRSKKM